MQSPAVLRGTLHRQEETAFMRLFDFSLDSVRITLRHHLRRPLLGAAVPALVPIDSINPREQYL